MLKSVEEVHTYFTFTSLYS